MDGLGREVGVHKKPLRFIELVEQWKEQAKDFGFVIIGDGALRELLEEEIRVRKLSDLVYLDGWAESLPEVYSGLDVFINTSDNEGSPVAVLESMACGLPILATDVGGVRETLKWLWF